jgi:hypothetical protein
MRTSREMKRASLGTFKAGAGVDYTSGEYGGTETINQVYVPVGVAYRAARWGMRLTVPYVSVDGPGTIIDSGGEFIAGPDESRSGLGDVVLGVALYDVVRDDDAGFYVDLGAKVKFGTASDTDGLGTGENDYSVQADVLKNFDRLALFGTFGYKLRGDPQGVDLRNVGFGTIGGDYRVASRTRIGLMYDYRPSAISGGDALQEATAYASFSSGRTSIQPYLVAGFSDSSSDWGAGLSIGWRP